MPKYHQYSKQVAAIFAEFTPLVQMVSIDEAYLDLTGSERLHGPTLRAADRLIRTVKARAGLNCSVGAATSHVVAKIASDQAKPHGLLYVVPGQEPGFLEAASVRRMPGIGKFTEPESSLRSASGPSATFRPSGWTGCGGNSANTASGFTRKLSARTSKPGRRGDQADQPRDDL